MSFLIDLYQLSEAEDLDSIPEDMFKELQKNIRDGAQDQEQKWANALDLVHKAYEVAGAERPSPDMKNAWKQYEEILTYAVAQLAKARGMKGDWRMSSAVFREAMESRKMSFRVQEMGNDWGKGHTVHAKSLDEVIDKIKNKGSGYDVNVRKSPDPDNTKMVTLEFSKFGIRKNYRVRIQQL